MILPMTNKHGQKYQCQLPKPKEVNEGEENFDSSKVNNFVNVPLTNYSTCMHQYCHIVFLFKFFDKMVNKRDFLKIINLYLLPSHPWKNPLPNPPRLENLVPNLH